MSLETKLKELVRLEKKKATAQKRVSSISTEITELRQSINEQTEKLGLDCNFS